MAKKKKKKKNKVSASMLKKIRKDIKKEDTDLGKLEEKIEKLSNRVEKSIKTNVELQEKVVELMTHLTRLVENIQTMSQSLTKGKTSKEAHKSAGNLQEKTPSKPENVSGQLQFLAKQNKELTDTLRSLEGQLKKEETRESIRKALEKIESTR